MIKKITLPISEDEVRALKIGDQVQVNGRIFTARDMAHKYLYQNKPEMNLKDGCLYHCGPIAKKTESGYKILAAGPTTSIRQEPFTPEIVRHYGVRVIMGKGGMGKDTADCLRDSGGVYLQAVGGAAQVLAQKIVAVREVHLLELGEPEAIWELEVRDFPAVVAMDSHGKSLYEQIEAESFKKLNEFSDGSL